MNEKEVTLYAKIGDMQGLAKAQEVETHYQYETAHKSGKYSRTRTIIRSEQKTHVYTVKRKIQGIDGIHASDERNVNVDADYIEVFKAVADQLLIKDRFVFICKGLTFKMTDGSQTTEVDIPEIKYEVDVFKTKAGGPSEWCKIDVEVDSLEKYISEHYPQLGKYRLVLKVSDLPIRPTEVIFLPEATDAQKEFVSKLWSEQFRLPVEVPD